MAATTATNSVFVGNINFQISEEQLIQLFETVGRVVRFRLITDKDTGRSRGFGFMDFADADAAASAIRNLDGYELQGRTLKVSLPHESGDKDGGKKQQAMPQSTDHTQPAAVPPSTLPPLPPGVDLPPNLKCTDTISQTLNQIPPPQLLDVLTQMKAMAISEPAKAQELLKAAPQLSYAIFQALILMNLVDPQVLGQVVEQAANPPQSAPIPQQAQPQYPGYPPQGMQGIPPRPPIPQSYQSPLPVQQPLQPQQPQQPPQINQQDLIAQVLAMDQRTIDTLPPAERQQIMMLRQQYGR